jgi:transcriptional regulator with XRE-family HTH domain
MSEFLDRLLELLGDKEPIPNKVTIGIGKAIKQAREDAGMSQAYLANMIYRRRATISDLENGKSEVSVSTLVLIAAALDKPITYFLPWYMYANLKPEDLETADQEMLLQFQKIGAKDLQRLAIQQVKLISDVDIRISKKLLEKQLADLTPDED